MSLAVLFICWFLLDSLTPTAAFSWRVGWLENQRWPHSYILQILLAFGRAASVLLPVSPNMFRLGFLKAWWPQNSKWAKSEVSRPGCHQCYFCHIFIVKVSHETSPDSAQGREDRLHLFMQRGTWDGINCTQSATNLTTTSGLCLFSHEMGTIGGIWLFMNLKRMMKLSDHK